jgi:hypothetical protein
MEMQLCAPDACTTSVGIVPTLEEGWFAYSSEYGDWEWKIEVWVEGIRADGELSMDIMATSGEWYWE